MTDPNPLREDEVDWMRLAFVTGFEQALYNTSMSADEFFDEWIFAGCPSKPEAEIDR